MEKKTDLTILVVDDNPVNIEILKIALSKEGYNVITAQDGKTARQYAENEMPELIILDIVMPVEDGFETAEKLKKNAKTSFIPIIFLTGKDELEFKIKGFKIGAVDYITKPFQITEVLARVRTHLKLSIATNSLIKSQAEKLRQIQHAQKSILITPESLPNAQFGVYYKALLEAGGDFYEVIKISDHIFGYFIADFSGHNIETSYMTSAIKALIKQNCIPVYEPLESMRIINNVLTEILPEGKYLTFCYIKLNRKTKTATVVSGGHPPVVYMPNDAFPELIKLEGDVLGIFSDISLGHREIKVKSGDRFFLYSDGLIEKPGENIIWTKGLETLLETCQRARNAAIRNAPEKISEYTLGKSYVPEDDIMLLGVEV